MVVGSHCISWLVPLENVQVGPMSPATALDGPTHRHGKSGVSLLDPTDSGVAWAAAAAGVPNVGIWGSPGARARRGGTEGGSGGEVRNVSPFETLCVPVLGTHHFWKLWPTVQTSIFQQQTNLNVSAGHPSRTCRTDSGGVRNVTDFFFFLGRGEENISPKVGNRGFSQFSQLHICFRLAGT